MTQPVSSGEADHSQQFQGENSRDAPRNGGYDSATYAPPGGRLAVPTRLRNRYGDGHLNGNAPSSSGNDMTTMAREALFNGPQIPMPNVGVMNGMPPSGHFGQRQITPYERSMGGYPIHQPVPAGVYYPGFVGGTPLTPVNYPHLPWGPPGTHGTPISSLGPHSQNSWAPAEDAKVPMGDFGTSGGYHGFPSLIDRPPMGSYPMIPSLHLQQPCLQYQMMKTSTGYIIQDLEALTQQDPAIPRAVPAMWTNSSDLTLAKCLENREGITNVYIRGFLPETTDEMLHAYASRFGQIERCKAIVDLETGMCKGFAFVQFYNFDSCENCIRGFYYLGYQASFAQKSRNSRLKDLEDRSSTNVYCTNVPITWSEADLRRHFEPFRVVSEKISRDDKTGVSKEVGFARFENRDVAEDVLNEFHNVPGKDGVKLLLRFADTKAQKLLKQQSNERRAYRAGEYNYSVEVVQGSTPSPATSRLGHGLSQASPISPLSYQSPAGAGPAWTPATTISPSLPVVKNSAGRRALNSWPSRTPLVNIENTPGMRGRHVSAGPSALAENHQPAATPKSTASVTAAEPRTPSPKKPLVKASSVSPVASRKEVDHTSPKSTV